MWQFFVAYLRYLPQLSAFRLIRAFPAPPVFRLVAERHELG